VGLWFLIIAGTGEAMASVFDITHPIGHGIAGLLGVIGFPIAALLLSVALGHNKTWTTARRPLFWIANLSWISIVLLAATLAIMTMQMARITGGHLPQHAPETPVILFTMTDLNIGSMCAAIDVDFISKVDRIPKLLERVDALLPPIVPNDGATLS
jgi:hypothetical protein